jgi:hypothetical protein
MAKKKKVYSPQFASDISLGEDGQCTFNILAAIAELRLVFTDIFRPSQEEIFRFMNRESGDRSPAKALSRMQRLSWEEAKAELHKGSEADIQKCLLYAVNLLEVEIGPFLDDKLRELVNDIVKRTIEELESQIATKVQGDLGAKVKKAVKRNQAHKRQLLGLPNPVRPKGTGLFSSEQEFLEALEDVLSRYGKLSQPRALWRLSQHDLYRGKPLNLEECQKGVKNLRNWLTRSGLTWAQALERYCPNTYK